MQHSILYLIVNTQPIVTYRYNLNWSRFCVRFWYDLYFDKQAVFPDVPFLYQRSVWYEDVL